MRMKFLRILPETCASTSCSFSSFTLNIALGNGSITTAITSIASSLLIQPQFNPALPLPELIGQDHRTIFCYRDAVLEVSAWLAILGHCRPLVVQHPDRCNACVHHRLDRDHHALAQLQPVLPKSIVRDLRVFVQLGPDAVAHELAHHAEPGGLDELLHRRADIAH